ncbi:CRTAC1 family protein [Paraglaciecola arctica]|uniref:CRTAC1 family protein n=1 Tax=Paraglaciecola arctica TaxID=1128911 RepID=UPI001C07CD6E|nr:CRTAC1 family protein [Paraglaciecola arctica]MBU3005292.1 CRTAC1 family protein [Paraglaciecola arctica]
MRVSSYSMTLLVLGIISCQSSQVVSQPKVGIQQSMFSEAIQDFDREQKNLRQWDAPIIADLDQDGYPDVLLNDHGFAVRVMWNNKGKYSYPYDVIMGDMHGLSVADFNHDGNLDIVISRGGGSGANARNSKIISVTKDREFVPLADFEPPLSLMRGRTVKFVDLDNDGDLDLINFAFPSKEKKGQSENYIYENTGDGQLIVAGTLPGVKQNGQKTLVTDFNQDNITDLVIYGHGAVKAYQGKGDLSFTDVSSVIFPDLIEDVTAIAEIDFDNDGDMDLFFSRGKEFYAGQTFYDPTTKVWGFYTKRGPFDFGGLTIGDVLNIENLQSQWPNKNLYIGESVYDYAFPGENHSGRDIRIINSDALGFAESMNKKGTYIGYIGNRQWRIAGELWAPSTGIVHNVEGYKASENQIGLSNLLLENRQGKFVDVTQSKGILVKAHSTGVAVADIDNNGYQDLIVRHRGNLVNVNPSSVFLNSKTGFKQSSSHGITTTELGAYGLGIQAVDHNLDGKMDFVVGNERGKWHLFRNTQSKVGNYITLDFGQYVSSTPSALGAKVQLIACGMTQTKTIGATAAAYSLSFNPLVHFGLGDCIQPVNIKVTWSDGSETFREKATFNQVSKVKFNKRENK